ncbi:redoxin domain-containing protein [bacterium]|nr:redoxin domain-containing protein [bacterium]
MKSALPLLLLLLAPPLSGVDKEVAAGDPAPAFTATFTTGGERSLDEFRGGWVVLYFFPRSFTPGCTTQSCVLRDGYGMIEAMGATILGVSMDATDLQQDFRAEYELPFDLVSDKSGKIATAYGVLAQVFRTVDVSRHDREVRTALAELTGNADTTLDVPALYAVEMYADWCSNCRAMAPALESAMDMLAKDPVLLVVIDFTDDNSTEQAGMLAGALGLGRIYLENEGLTGYVLLVDPGSGEVLGRLTPQMTAEEMVETVRGATPGGQA